jgi:2-dehydro-3-deoxygalactonokinase
MQQKHIISCDWGTSSLRLQLIDTASLSCLAKVSSNEGNAAIFNQWKAAGNADRVLFYLKHLQPLLIELSATAGLSAGEPAVVISGMSSSTLGIKELPYADLPFNLDGSAVNFEWIDGRPLMDNPILLISGVHQPDDVMRGEETQLIGIVTLLNLPHDNNLMFILPGTHSKHILVKDNNISQFKTFMTGEVFDILTKHSILSLAVSNPGRRTGNERPETADSHLSSVVSHEAYEITDEEKTSFQKGVNKALRSELLSALFSVRINQLKKYLSAQQNYFYLSGLLIGSELKYLLDNANQHLVLCSSGRLLQLYQMAIECAGLSERTITVPAEVLDNAAAAGQVKILDNVTSKII